MRGISHIPRALNHRMTDFKLCAVMISFFFLSPSLSLIFLLLSVIYLSLFISFNISLCASLFPFLLISFYSVQLSPPFFFYPPLLILSSLYITFHNSPVILTFFSFYSLPESPVFAYNSHVYPSLLNFFQLQSLFLPLSSPSFIRLFYSIPLTIFTFVSATS